MFVIESRGMSTVADEVTVAKAKLQAKIDAMKAKPKNTYAGLSELITEMQGIVENALTTVEEVNTAIAKVEAFEYKFANDKGEGKYLSDLTEVSADPGYGSYRKDTNIDGNGKISLYTEDGNADTAKTYEKGIGLHSRDNNGENGTNPTDAVYNVSEYKVFSADIGIDASQPSGRPSKVIFKVLLSKDATGNNYTEVYSSEEMTAGKAAKHIEIDLLQAQRMQIVVDSCGEDSNDHAVWADAKVYNTYSPSTTEEKELKIVSANAPSVQTDQEADKAFDKNMNTQWHTEGKTDCPLEKRWIDFELENVSYVDAVSMLMRLDSGNGTIQQSEIWVSENGHSAIEGEAGDAWKADYTKVALGVWNNTKKNLKTIHFDPVKAKHIRVVATEIKSDNAFHFAAMPEFKAYGTPVTEGMTAPESQFIKFLGGSLRTTPNDGTYERANMRFGYEIATKNDAVGYKTAFTNWGFDYNIVGGESHTIVGQKKIDSPTSQGMEISNLVVTNIPVVGYQKDVNCCCYVTYELGNNERVKLYSSEIDQTRNVAEVATAVVKNEAEESPESVAYAKELLKMLPNAQ